MAGWGMCERRADWQAGMAAGGSAAAEGMSGGAAAEGKQRGGRGTGGVCLG